MSSLHSSATIFGRNTRQAWGLTALFVAAFLLASQTIAAQQVQSPSHAPAAAAKKSPRHRAHKAEAPAPVEEPAPPPQPEPPKFPVDDSPNKASVTWDSGGLRIQADNASLHQILNEVSADTGTKVEGIGTDERVFGEFGPGTTRDVISQLLHGSSYNVLMIGDEGSGTPRQIVLSARRSGYNPQQTNHPDRQVEQPDEDVPDQPEENEQPQPPMINNGRPPMQMVPQGPPGVPPGPPGAPRTPQQVLQELQQRQQQIQDQQQQQQQQPH